MKNPVLDESTLFCWKEVDPQNWRQIVIEITDIFFETSISQEKTLKDSFQARNADGVRRTAHMLKSTCGNVGARLAFSILDQIEKLAEQGNLAEAEILMVGLEPIFFESRLAVSELLARAQAA